MLREVNIEFIAGTVGEEKYFVVALVGTLEESARVFTLLLLQGELHYQAKE